MVAMGTVGRRRRSQLESHSLASTRPQGQCGHTRAHYCGLAALTGTICATHVDYGPGKALCLAQARAVQCGRCVKVAAPRGKSRAQIAGENIDEHAQNNYNHNLPRRASDFARSKAAPTSALGPVTMALRSVRSIFRPDLFEGRVAIVTGGATGIGRAIASELALLSCRVVIASRDEQRLSEAAKQISSADGVKHSVEPIVCNIRNTEEVGGGGAACL